MKLRNVVISALLVATMSIGMTSFISTGLTEYNVSNNVDEKELKKLNKLQNATAITKKAQTRAANVESKSNYFNLPGVVKTGKLTFDALKLWDLFFRVIISVTGLGYAAQDWPLLFATGTLSVSVAYIFVKRFI